MNDEREQLLISRVVDGEASDHEWRDLELLANDNPMVWRDLAQAQRDHADLTRLLASAARNADATPLPSPAEAFARTSSANAPALDAARLRSSHTHALRFNRFGAWTGWAAAAVVAIIASLHHAQNNSTTNMRPLQPVQTAGANLQSAAQAFQTYLEKGRESGQVVGELPAKVLLDTKPVITGQGYEVIYLRQVMERTIVPDLYRFTGQDDTGRPILIRYEQAAPNSM